MSAEELKKLESQLELLMITIEIKDDLKAELLPVLAKYLPNVKIEQYGEFPEIYRIYSYNSMDFFRVGQFHGGIVYREMMKAKMKITTPKTAAGGEGQTSSHEKR